MKDVSEMENVYDDAENFLDKQEDQLYAGRDDFISIYTDPYYNQIPGVTDSMNAGVSNLNNQIGTAGFQEQNALASGRRLFGELSARNRQAFGGASSVGQAASEIAAREFQRQIGTVRNTAAQTVQKIITQINEVKSKADTMINKLKADAELARKEAQLAFQDKINFIDQKRYELKQQKAIDKIEALKELRDRILSIQEITTAKTAEVDNFRVTEMARIQQEGAGYNTFVDNSGAYGTDQLNRQGAISSAGQQQFGAANQLGNSYGSANSALQTASGFIPLGGGRKTDNYETMVNPFVPPTYDEEEYAAGGYYQ
jgi:hypothetical protein